MFLSSFFTWRFYPVRSWERYRRSTGLKNAPKRGRKRKLNDQQLSKLKTIVDDRADGLNSFTIEDFKTALANEAGETDQMDRKTNKKYTGNESIILNKST